MSLEYVEDFGALSWRAFDCTKPRQASPEPGDLTSSCNKYVVRWVPINVYAIA